jgi:phospholipase C
MNRLFPLALAGLCLSAPASATSFQHIILVIQENRTPDNMFQGLCTPSSACSTTPGPGQYNIQTTGWFDKTSPTGTTNPHANPFGLGYDLSHAHSGFVAMCDKNASGACAMDGAANVQCYPYASQCPSKPAFGYIDNSGGAVQPYLDLVHAYGWGNYFFQTNQGPSFPAHQYLFGATSAYSAFWDQNGYFAAENVQPVGCAAPSATRVVGINPQGVENFTMFPCFYRYTLSDLLELQNVSWRYYGSGGPWLDPQALGIWVAPNAIEHICVPINGQCTGSDWTAHVTFTQSAILSDIANCKLSGVSWVIPDSFDSDHSLDVRNTGGPSWVASIVNAVGTTKCTSPNGYSYWNGTAIIVVWDDWGGWYDHVPPPTTLPPYTGYEIGFRVPLIVVSAYTPAGFINNNYPESFGSIIRFVEQNFGITEGGLGFADSRAQGDLTEFFTVPVRPFRSINAPLKARYFLKRKPSGLPVDND